MRYSRQHKQRTRTQILDVASRKFREAGAEGVGVADLMAEAGLTHGGFYKHFRSKEELLGKAAAHALHAQREVMETEERTGAGLEPAIRRYLSEAHRDAPGTGCAVAALAPELARHPRATRAPLAGELEEILSLMARQLPGRSAAVRRRKAMALYGQLVGTLQLARAVTDLALSEELLAAGLDAALGALRSR